MKTRSSLSPPPVPPQPFTDAATTLYADPWNRLVQQRFRRPDGAEGRYSYLEKADGVAIAPRHADGSLTMVWNYRIPVACWSLEFPMGGVEPGETPLAAAARELAEEVGLRAERWTPMGQVWPASGFCTTRCHLFLAEGLNRQEFARDPGERILPVSAKLPEIEQYFASNLAVQSVAALLLAKIRLMDVATSPS